MAAGNLITPSTDDPSVYEVHLPCGRVALVDEEDIDRIREYRWHSKAVSRKGKKTGDRYVECVMQPNGRKPPRISLLMHRHLFALDQGDSTQVDHKNGDGLDNRRKENLRLATHRQNQANRRKLSMAASRFKGVCWSRASKRWTATATVRRGLKTTRIGLGYFDIEAEAAFAYNAVTPSLRDKRFVKLNDIPDHEMPSVERQKEIRVQAVFKTKAVLEGRKAISNPTSQYRCVSFIPDRNKWRCMLRVANKKYFVGLFDTELEAAWAYDISLDAMKLAKKHRNNIPDNQVSLNSRSRILGIVASKFMEAT